MIEIKLTNKKLKWVIGTCILLAALAMFGTFLIPDSMQNVVKTEVDKYIVCYFILSIILSLFLILALTFWLLLLWKEKRLKRRKWFDIGLALGIVILCILFFMGGAIHFHRRYHTITFQEMVEKYEEGSERGSTPKVLPSK